MIDINGELLKQKLKKYNISGQQLSEQIGKSRNYISNAITRNLISEKALALISQNYDIDIIDVILDVNVDNQQKQIKHIGNMINIDGNALRHELNKKGVDRQKLSKELGMNKSYIAGCISQGKIRRFIFEAIIKKYQINPDLILTKEPFTTKDSYSINIDVDKNNLHVVLKNVDKEIYNAYLIVNGEVSIALFNAINFVSLMICDLEEQNN